MSEVNSQIDTGVEILTDLIRAGSTFYPPLAIASPLLTSFIKYEAGRWKAGLAAGTIIPDGQGGFIPAHGQSIYDPKTGFFTGEKT